MDAETKAQFERLHKKLNLLIEHASKATWIGPGMLAKLTGWNSEGMRQARNKKIVEHRRSGTGGWEYKLESIPEVLIIKQTA